MSDYLKDRLPSEDRISIQSAEKLAVLWWDQQKKKPNNIPKRVATAAILSNQPVPTDTREGITATIRFALKNITSIPLDKKLIEVQLQAYEREELNLFDLFQYELEIFGAFNLSENPQMNLIARILGNADGDEFLMDLPAYEKYIAAGGTKLIIIEEPYEVPTPNNRAMVVKIAKK